MILSRRNFLAGLASAGALLFTERVAKAQPVDNQSIPSIEELHHTLDYEYSPNVSAVSLYYEKSNLVSAYELMRPASHLESSIVVWAAFQRNPFKHFLEEYSRRRAGMPPRMFNHDVLKSRQINFPYTHQILFFSEQVNALVRRIVDSDEEHLARRIWLAQFPFPQGDEIYLEEFIDSVQPGYWFYYPDSKEEIAQMYLFIQNSYEMALPYSWCSGIVTEALRLKGKDV